MRRGHSEVALRNHGLAVMEKKGPGPFINALCGAAIAFVEDKVYKESLVAPEQ